MSLYPRMIQQPVLWLHTDEQPHLPLLWYTALILLQTRFLQHTGHRSQRPLLQTSQQGTEGTWWTRPRRRHTCQGRTFRTLPPYELRAGQTIPLGTRRHKNLLQRYPSIFQKGIARTDRQQSQVGNPQYSMIPARLLQ